MHSTSSEERERMSGSGESGMAMDQENCARILSFPAGVSRLAPGLPTPPPLPEEYLERYRVSIPKAAEPVPETIEQLIDRLIEREQELSTLRYLQSILHLRTEELRTTHEKIGSLEAEQVKLLEQSQTIDFLKQQLRLRNQELLEETTIRKEMERRLDKLEDASSTLSFLQTQLRARTDERDRERRIVQELQEQIRFFHGRSERYQVAGDQYKRTIESELSEERITSAILSYELARRDRMIQNLTKTLSLQAEIIADQKSHLGRLHEEVHLSRRLIQQIRDAFAPFMNLLLTSPPTAGIERISALDGPHLINDIAEYRPSPVPGNIDTPDMTKQEEKEPQRLWWTDSRIVALEQPVKTARKEKQKATRRLKWSRVSVLVLFFILTTFGTTDIFSHFKPFNFEPTAEDLLTLPTLPQLLTIPMSQHAIDMSLRAMKHAVNNSPHIILDPGHGGYDSGAVSLNGLLKESEFALAIALETERHLKAMNIPTIMTRRTDQYLSLEARKSIANHFPGSYFVSVHLNAHPLNSTHEANGFSVFYNDNRSYSLARTIYSAADKILFLSQYNNGIIDGRRFYKDGNNRLGVLKDLNHPGVVIETGFISHPRDLSMIADPDFRERLSLHIAQGINDYYHEKR